MSHVTVFWGVLGVEGWGKGNTDSHCMRHCVLHPRADALTQRSCYKESTTATTHATHGLRCFASLSFALLCVALLCFALRCQTVTCDKPLHVTPFPFATCDKKNVTCDKPLHVTPGAFQSPMLPTLLRLCFALRCVASLCFT